MPECKICGNGYDNSSINDEVNSDICSECWLRRIIKKAEADESVILPKMEKRKYKEEYNCLVKKTSSWYDTIIYGR